MAQVTMQDSLALVAFYNSTGGDNWTNNENWLTGMPVGTQGNSIDISSLPAGHFQLAGMIDGLLRIGAFVKYTE